MLMKKKLIVLGVLTLGLGIAIGVAIVNDETQATIEVDKKGHATFKVQMPQNESGVNVNLSLNEIVKMDISKSEKLDRLMESVSGQYVNIYDATNHYAYVVEAYNAENYLGKPSNDSYMLNQILSARLAYQFYAHNDDYEYIAGFLEHYDKLMTAVYLGDADDKLIEREQTEMMKYRWAMDEDK